MTGEDGSGQVGTGGGTQSTGFQNWRVERFERVESVVWGFSWMGDQRWEMRGDIGCVPRTHDQDVV